ncbi:MAG: 2-hydroxyacid dehydrogenase [Rhodospirillales bacterium]|jgi:hydroxypyruvate reductase|nr:2-hydroxyacid dehydrogenase [Rhodospirillales bacterium]
MKPEILVASPMPAPTMRSLDENFILHKLFEAKDQDAFLAAIKDKVRGIATSGGKGASAALMDALPKTEIIANFGVGYDAVDVPAAKARNIPITNTPDVLTDDVADLALALLLDSARLISRADRFVRAGLWLKGNHPFGQAVAGKKLGIVGLGRIGAAIATRAEAFKLQVSWHGPRPKPDAKWPYVADLVTLAREVDFLCVICPLTPQTFHLITREVMEALGPEGTLINVARGPVVDEAALVDALKTGKLGHAALDVFEDEPRVPEALFAMENTVLLPHQGSATTETRTAMGQLVVDNLVAHFAGKPLLTRVA